MHQQQQAPTHTCPNCGQSFPSKYAARHHACKPRTLSVEFQMSRIVETLIDGEPPAHDTRAAWRPTEQQLQALKHRFS